MAVVRRCSSPPKSPTDSAAFQHQAATGGSGEAPLMPSPRSKAHTVTHTKSCSRSMLNLVETHYGSGVFGGANARQNDGRCANVLEFGKNAWHWVET